MLVPVNELGKRIGEQHHNARISDEMVDKIRELHEDEGLGYRRISKLLGIKRQTVQKICNYERRAQTPTSWKKVKDKAGKAT